MCLMLLFSAWYYLRHAAIRHQRSRAKADPTPSSPSIPISRLGRIRVCPEPDGALQGLRPRGEGSQIPTPIPAGQLPRAPQSLADAEKHRDWQWKGELSRSTKRRQQTRKYAAGPNRQEGQLMPQRYRTPAVEWLTGRKGQALSARLRRTWLALTAPMVALGIAASRARNPACSVAQPHPRSTVSKAWFTRGVPTTQFAV